MSKEQETLNKLISFAFVMSENMVGLTKGNYDEATFIKKTYEYLHKYNVDLDSKVKLKETLQKKSQIEQELGCSLIDLLNGLKSKQSALRYFDKHDSMVNHCEEGWYVNMIMYGWIPLKDFIKGLN